MGEHARVVGKAPRHMTGRSALPLIFGLALLGVGSGCSIESGGRGKPLEARAVGGTERVEEEGQVFLQLRQCPAGQLLLATETGWECGVLDRSGLVTEVQAGDGIQVKPEGAARRVSTAFAGSGGEAGLAPTVARSDHTHAPEAITGLTEALDSKADQAWVENELVKKANVGHTHVTDDVIGLPEQLATKADQTAVDTALAAMAPLEHVHDLGDIEGLEQAIASVAQATIEAGVDWRLLENVPAVWPGTIAWEHIDQRPDVAALQQAIAALQTQVGTLESQVQTLQQQRLADAVCPQGWEEARDPRARGLPPASAGRDLR